MKTKKREKSFWEMTEAERNELVKEFDKPIPLSKTRPLTKKERAQFEQMRRSPKRSIYVLKGDDGVFVRIKPGLLRRSSKFAAEHNMSLSDLINRSLAGVLAVVE
jgi:hypothetical protein